MRGDDAIERYQVSGTRRRRPRSPRRALHPPAANESQRRLARLRPRRIPLHRRATAAGDEAAPATRRDRQCPGPHRQPARQDAPHRRRRTPSPPDRNYAIPPTIPSSATKATTRSGPTACAIPGAPSFDRETGDLWIGDVGQSAKEEIDFQPAASAGRRELRLATARGHHRDAHPAAATVGGPRPPGAIDPIYEYDHTPQVPDRSITGGYVYRGPVAELQGKYFFVDFSNARNRVVALRRLGPGRLRRHQLHRAPTDWTPVFTPDQATIETSRSYAEDAAGNLYLLDLGASSFRPAARSIAVVPEPTTATLVGTALAALAAVRRRTRKS